MIKRALSIALAIAVVLTMFGAFPAYASDTTVVHAIGSDRTEFSVKEYTAHAGSGQTSPMYKGESLTYSLDFDVSGEYRLSLKNQSYGSPEAEIVINGWSIFNKTIPNSDGKLQTVELGTIHVGKGTTDILFKLHGTACYLNAFVIERIGDRREYYINGANPDNISAGVTDGKPSTGMSYNSYGEYKFTAEKDGVYALYTQVASTANTSALIDAYIDGENIGIGSHKGIDWTVFETVYVASANITAGEHTLKIRAGQGAMRFRTAKLIYVSKEDSENFLCGVRSAKGSTGIKNILTEYSGKLFTPYNDYLDELTYDGLLCHNLAGLDCDSIAEFDDIFMSLYNDEMNNPLVSVTQNGQAVPKPASGEFAVTIAPRFSRQVTAVAAVYTNDGKKMTSVNKAQTVPFGETVITGLTASEDAGLIRIFFLDGEETLRPAELPVVQTAIYVSPVGNDKSDGTAGAPLKTIAGAVEKAKQNNTLLGRDTNIYLMSGEHFVDSAIAIDDSFSLTDNCGIHFMSLNPDESAVISGGCDITGWTDANGDGIYEAAVPDTVTDVRQLYINDLPAMRAKSSSYYVADGRWDNEENNATSSAGKALYAEDGFYTYNPSFPKLTKPEDAEISYLILWTVQRLPVEDIVYEDDDKALIKMEQPYYSTAITALCDGGIQPTIGQKFTVENDLSLLDEAGEFYFDKDTRKIYYKPFPAEDLETARTVVGKTEQFFNISGSSKDSKVRNVSFENIDFRYAGYYTKVNAEGAVCFQAENLIDASKGHYQNAVSTGVGRTLEANILVENADGISFENCDFSCMGATALRYGTATTNSSVKGSTFTEIGGGALSIATWEGGKPIAEDIRIENNVIARIGLDFMFCPAISVYYAKNVNILHNTITHTPYSGISVGWGWAGPGTAENPSTPQRLGAGGHNISYNRIYDISRAVIDGGHVYNLGYMSECNITHNYFTDSPDHGGVYLDTGASNIKINNNVFERCDKYNIAYGNSASVVGNVAKDNWADKEQSKDWPGEGCSFETVVGVTGGNWPDKAKAVISNAGVSGDYKANLSKLDIPAWRMLDHQAFPREEGKIPGTKYIICNEYTDFYIKPAELATKPKPAIYTFSGTPGVADFRQREWLEYTVNVENAGDYYLSLYYNKGSDGTIDIYLTTSPIDEKYDNMYPSPGYGCPKPLFGNYKLLSLGTETTAHVPHVFTDSDGNKKPITLEKGTYYLRIHERSGGTNWSRFALTPVK